MSASSHLPAFAIFAMLNLLWRDHPEQVAAVLKMKEKQSIALRCPIAPVVQQTANLLPDHAGQARERPCDVSLRMNATCTTSAAV